METTEEEIVLTPASSPTSCDDVRSQREDRDDFVSLMDENGIIGLLEALEIVGVDEYRVEVESDDNGLLTETQLDEAVYRPSSSPSHRKSPGEDAQILPPAPGGVFAEKTLSGVHGTSLNGSRDSDRPSQPSRTIAWTVAAPSSASFGTISRNPTESTNAAALKNSSKSHLNGCTPDYSKVKPRVHFPKVSYKPPKSTSRSKGKSLSLRPGGVKSVDEDSRDMAGVPPATPDAAGERQELESPREATRLLSELEENYNKLWIKYAEAENTIDKLRLAAKVNLYSDGPKPGHLVQAVYNPGASKFMTLNFPQAQRAETSSNALPPDEHTTPQVRKEPNVTLYTQASDFLQRLQTFEDLLKCQQLSPDEQSQEFSQLFEGLRSLESSYLLAKDEHKRQPKEEENRHFDPDRELERLIFDCVLYMDELKEHAEQIQEDLLTREPSPSLSEGRENLAHPQGEASTLSSVSNESNREEARRETASSLYLETGNCNLGPSGDLNTLPDEHQNVREIPQALAVSQKSKAPLPTASKMDTQPEGVEEDEAVQKIENRKVKECPQKRHLGPEEFSHLFSGAQLINQANILDPLSGQEGFRMRTPQSSSLSSLGEIAALEKRNSKLQAGICRLPSQDGIVSPETDSGFNGTESCHPTPTGAPSPLHQGAMESVSVVQDRNPNNPHNDLVTSPDLFSLLPRRCPATERSTTTKLSTKQPRKSKPRKAQRRRTFTCAHHCWTKKSESGTSDVESSSSTVSEDGLTGRSRESVTTFSPNSSRSWRPRHSGCAKVRRSPEATGNGVSVQMLQAEVSRLHRRLESCLKERERSVSASETTVQENHHHPRTSTPRVSSRKVNTDATAAVRTRPCCSPEQGHHPDVLRSSDHTQTQSVVSRCTQTMSAASQNWCSHPNTVHVKHRSVSVQAPETSDEPDSKDLSVPFSHHPPPCLRCISRQQARAEDSPPGNSKAAVRSCCSSRHCRSTDTDCLRFAHANTNTCHQAAETVKCCPAPPPPPPLQYVCPLPLLLCSSPLRASPSNKKDTTTGSRSQKESKSRRKHSSPAAGQEFLDRSLNKAIRAAKHMESTSGHMSRSLRFGLHHQQLLLDPLMEQLSQRQTSS